MDLGLTYAAQCHQSSPAGSTELGLARGISKGQ